MNVLTRTPTALPQVSWWQTPNMVSLVRRTAFKDCNINEFDEAVAVSRELDLSPLRKQIYAFVFSKDDEKKRNMVLVVGIDGARAIAARTGNYRPDSKEPEWVFKDELKNPLTNPHGIEKCTVGVMHRPTKNDPFERIVHTVYWEEFAPILKSGGEDDYEWIETGETWPDTGKPKKKKKLIQGATVTLRLDPKKDAWIKAGRNQIAKCAEMGALRKGWPEDLSRIYAEEETSRAHTLEDVDYTDMTPSQAADSAEADKRLARIGGNDQIGATFDASNDIVYVPVGQFADRVLAATAKMTPADVVAWVERNTEALRYFWGKNATDALALKKELETRSAGAAGERQQQSSQPADKAAPAVTATPPDTTSAGAAPFLSKADLVAELEKVSTKADVLAWAQTHKVSVNALPAKERDDLMDAYYAKQDSVSK